MKKKIIIILSVIIVALLIILSIILLNNRKTNEFKIHMSTNGGVPYIWKYEISNDNVEYVDMESKNKYPDRAGGPVEEYYIFRTKKEGETTIIFRFKSVVDDSVSKEIKYNVSIDKDLKPTVKKVR